MGLRHRRILRLVLHWVVSQFESASGGINEVNTRSLERTRNPRLCKAGNTLFPRLDVHGIQARRVYETDVLHHTDDLEFESHTGDPAECPERKSWRVHCTRSARQNASNC